MQNVVKSRISPKISLHSMHFLVCCAPGFSFSKKNQPPLRLRHLPSLFRQGFSSCQTQTTRGAGDDHRLLRLQKGHSLGGFTPPPKINMTMENSPNFQIGDTSSHDFFANCHVSFRGVYFLKSGIKYLNFVLVEFWTIFLTDPGKLKLTEASIVRLSSGKSRCM